MNIEEAEAIYKHPEGHSRDKLTECLKVLNTIPHRLTLAEQVVIADARYRRDILEGVIEAEYRVIDSATPVCYNRVVIQLMEVYQW